RGGDRRARRSGDDVVRDREVVHFSDNAKCPVGLNGRTSLHDRIQELNHVSARDVLRLSLAPASAVDHVELKNALILFPRPFAWLCMLLDVFVDQVLNRWGAGRSTLLTDELGTGIDAP